MASKNIMEALNGLVKKAADEKSARLTKKASPGDGVDDGTSKPVTGEQMAKNKEMAAKGTAAKVDGGAKTNPVGGSVENSTEGAAAVSTSGQEGAKGGVLEKKQDAPNGPEGGIKSASLVEQLRKAASEGATAVAAPGEEENPAIKFLKKAFEKKASALDRFLADWARKNVKSAGALDDPAAAQAGADQMGQQAQGPQGEEQAEQMLLQMAQSGAITEQDLIQAMQELHQAQGAGAPPAGPDAGAGAPPAPPMAAGPDAGAPPADAGQMQDPALEAKMAAADVGPDHPDYIKKLSTLYSNEVNAGYAVGVKVAEEMAGEYNDHDDKPAEEPKHEAPKPDAAAITGGGPVSPDAPPAPPAHGGQDPMGGLQPVSEEQKAALLHVLTEMGITPEQLKQLLAEAPAAPQAHADPKMAAVADYRVKVRNLIMGKMAAAMEAEASAAPAK
jgi:hypothetical protein